MARLTTCGHSVDERTGATATHHMVPERLASCYLDKRRPRGVRDDRVMWCRFTVGGRLGGLIRAKKHLGRGKLKDVRHRRTLTGMRRAALASRDRTQPCR